MISPPRSVYMRCPSQPRLTLTGTRRTTRGLSAGATGHRSFRGGGAIRPPEQPAGRRELGVEMISLRRVLHHNALEGNSSTEEAIMRFLYNNCLKSYNAHIRDDSTW